MANGFVNRFLFVACRRARLLPEGGALDLDTHQVLLARLTDSLAWASATRRLRFDDAARAIWWDIYPTLSRSRAGLSGAICARAEAHVVRLAVIYAVLDGTGVIAPRHLHSALALWDYAERTVGFVFGHSLGDPLADEISRAIAASTEGISRTEIRDLFARNRPRAQIDRALNLLATAGHVERHLRTGPGRSTEMWMARPGT